MQSIGADRILLGAFSVTSIDALLDAHSLHASNVLASRRLSSKLALNFLVCGPGFSHAPSSTTKSRAVTSGRMIRGSPVQDIVRIHSE